jgi:hypothetical protein
MQDLSHGARRGKRQDDLLTVFVADGDKAADALDKLGLMAVGWAEDWDEDYQEHFDAADVIITPNNDDDSKRRCEAVARSLTGVARRVRVLNLPSIPSKGNACDWVEAGGTAKQLWQLVAKQSFNWTTDAGGDTDRLLVELTRMSPAEYGRRRRELAIELGISVTSLDREYNERRKRTKIEDDDRFLPDPDPWPEPVNGAELLEQLSKTAASHLVLPKGAADAIAMWVLFTHAHDCFDISPVLGVTSPTPECGKTTLLTFLGGVVPRPLPTSNVTAAALFRAVAKWGPTLLIDEADTFLRGNDELRGILNSGHKRSNAFVIRTSGTTTSRSTSPPGHRRRWH